MTRQYEHNYYDIRLNATQNKTIHVKCPGIKLKRKQ